jgi:hypothetical protein
VDGFLSPSRRLEEDDASATGTRTPRSLLTARNESAVTGKNTAVTKFQAVPNSTSKKTLAKITLRLSRVS